MRAVTFQAPGEIRLDERPEPELAAPDDAVVKVEATGVCGSDLHIYHGRVQIEPGFVIGHEFVGTVVAAGDEVTRVGGGRPGDRHLLHRLRRVLLLRARRLPQVRQRPRLRARRDAGLAPGRAGRDGAGPDRQSHAAPGAGGGLRRRCALRGRRDGHRLSRCDRNGRRPGRQPRRARPRARGPVRRAGGEGRRSRDRDRGRHRSPAARDGPFVRGHAGPPHRGGRSRRGQGGDRGPRGGRNDRRRGSPGRARAWPAG